MRIAHFIDSTDTRHGGVPRAVVDMVRLIHECGQTSTLITPDATDTPPAWLDSSSSNTSRANTPRAVTIPRGRLPFLALGPSGLRAVREQLKQTDVLHLNCIWSVANMQVASVARSMGVPYVISTHGMLDRWCMTQRTWKKQAYMSLGGTSMLNGAATVHCTAQAELEQSARWFPKTTGSVIALPLDLSSYRTLPGTQLAQRRFPFLADKSEATILFLSRLNYKKGCSHLLHALRALKDRGVRARLVFAGSGDEAYVRSLHQLRDQLDIVGRVHFVGLVKGAEKISLYQNADVFALPTSQENFGMVLVEALASGTPLVTTKGTDIWSDLQKSGGAKIVDQSATAFADAIETMIRNPEQRVAMGAAARPWVFKTYDEMNLGARYIRMYQAVAAGSKVGITLPQLEAQMENQTEAQLAL
jgi:glycosyltransferase involved in cell wall biosynthesis